MDSSLGGECPCYLLGSPSLSPVTSKGRPVPRTYPRFSGSMTLHSCCRPVQTRKCRPPRLLPEHALQMAHSEDREAQYLSFPCFSHVQTLTQKQMPLGLLLLMTKYSKQRTNNLFLPGTIFPNHLGRHPACLQPQ